MKAIRDPEGALARGLASVRERFHVPASFPPDVLAAADRAVRRRPSEHADLTAWPFVTLDPASSTDLDQAFHLERSGDDIVVHYAIADVAWFVQWGDAVDAEAWRRGTTLYLPDGRAPLYPPVIGEHAASLLPDGPRPAVVFHTRVAGDGSVRLDGVTRAIVRSTAKLAYDRVRADELPADFDEVARRVQAAEASRGAARVDPPEQEVVAQGDGRYTLVFRARVASEDRNAALSLATNMAVADALYAAGTGLFRVMPEPDARAVRRLRHTARAWSIDWPDGESLASLERRLDGANPREAALMLAVRRAGGGARYEPFRPGDAPWHAAVAARYCHATAPLRRLADRATIEAVRAVADGRDVPAEVIDAIERLPAVMQRADQRGAQIERAVLDLAETVMLAGDVGRTFAAVVTDVDDRGARIQLRDEAVVTRVAARGVEPGDDVRVRLTAADVEAGSIAFERVA